LTDAIDAARQHSMKFRKLRIAWSVLCAIACVLLIVLWVRSCWWWDVGQGPLLEGVQFSAASQRGRLIVSIGAFEIVPITSWGGHSVQSNYEQVAILSRIAPTGFAFFHSGGYWVIHIPHWFATSGLAALAAAPWLRWRFRLRTLLIATALVAVVLGLIVWANR
jgi:hypothetical protein